MMIGGRRAKEEEGREMLEGKGVKGKRGGETVYGRE